MTQRTLIQFFHWYYPGDCLWADVAREGSALAEMGVTDVWLPPATKGASGRASTGYDTYDLFDLGEFDQKGSVATRYGSRDQLEAATKALADAGLRVIHDVVFNHKMGADETERVGVRRTDPEDRTRIDDEVFEASAHTRFTFPGRAGAHSQFVWDHKCFSGVDCIEDPEETGVFRLVNDYGEGEWNEEVDEELGNFDYLMGADVEFRNCAVYEELMRWGEWMAAQVPVHGFRLDAAKHIPAWFFRDWVGRMRQSIADDLFVVAEYWHPDMEALQTYLDRVDQQLALFDVALVHRFHDAARAHGDFDLRTIFDGSLVSTMPGHAVTLVGNHDTQPLQALEAPVEDWFKPLAYALILLREGGTPCLFHPDLYGATYSDVGGDDENHEITIAPVACLSQLTQARQRFAHGAQTDLFERPECIGFVRHGTQDQPGCVVVMTNSEDDASLRVELGPDHAGAAFVDWLGHCQDTITANEQGALDLRASPRSVSVWVRADAA